MVRPPVSEITATMPVKEWAGLIQELSMYFPLIGTKYILDLYLFIAYFKRTPVLSLSLALPGLVVQSVGCSLQI